MVEEMEAGKLPDEEGGMGGGEDLGGGGGDFD